MSLVDLAVRPFQVLEALGLPAQYERSFKLEAGELITQRYMLGVDAKLAPQTVLEEAVSQIGMPHAMRPLFAQALASASTVLFGFEGSENPERSDGRAVFKVYVEYRSRLLARGADDSPIELFRGFKWHAEHQSRSVQTIYWCRPGLSNEAIRSRISVLLADPTLANIASCCVAILDRIDGVRPTVQSQWLELGELNQPVRAFDLNLYSAGLKVMAIARPIQTLSEDIGVDRKALDRLLALAGHGLLGHLSAGTSRNGRGFLTIYFEPARGTDESP
jgi:hypothetical protein